MTAQDVATTVPDSTPMPPRKGAVARIGWLHVVAVEALIGAVLRGVALARPIDRLDRIFVPDDTYYTLSIARSIAHGHGPTTDGQTLTSGFQPLVAFLLSPVFWLSDQPEVGLRANLVLLIICDVAIIVLLAVIAYRIAGPVAAVVAGGVWAVSPAATRIALGGLETSLAMLCEVALVAVWMWARDRPSTRRYVLVGVVAGLAILGRVDAVLLVALLVAVQLWRGPRRPLATIAASCAVTLAPWWGYCLVQFGSPIPASGSAAHALQPGDPLRPLMLSLSGSNALTGPFGAWTSFETRMATQAQTWPFWVALAVFVAGAGVLVAWSYRRPSGHTDVPSSRAFDLVCAATLPLFGAGLVVFYAWYNVIYYTYRYVAPAAMGMTLLVAWLIATVGEVASRAGPTARRVATAVAVAVLIVVTAGPVVRGNRVVLRAKDAPRQPYDAATGYRDQAKAVNRIVPPDRTVGALQTGALSYFLDGGRTALNLDGVVNPDAYEARSDDRLGAYIQSQNVQWFADYALTIGSLWLELRRVDPTVRARVVRDLPGRPGMPTIRVAVIR